MGGHTSLNLRKKGWELSQYYKSILKFRIPYLLICAYFYFFAEDDLDELLKKVRAQELDLQVHGDGADGLNL